MKVGYFAMHPETHTMNMGIKAAQLLWPVWALFFKSKWAEVVVPKIASTDRQIVGFLVPIGMMPEGDAVDIATEYSTEAESEASFPNKPLWGKVWDKDRTCLSVIYQYNRFMTEEELKRAVISLQRQIKLTFNLPSIVIRSVSSLEARRYLC